jgi:hypothetical protein
MAWCPMGSPHYGGGIALIALVGSQAHPAPRGYFYIARSLGRLGDSMCNVSGSGKVHPPDVTRVPFSSPSEKT